MATQESAWFNQHSEHIGKPSDLAGESNSDGKGSILYRTLALSQHCDVDSLCRMVDGVGSSNNPITAVRSFANGEHCDSREDLQTPVPTKLQHMTTESDVEEKFVVEPFPEDNSKCELGDSRAPKEVPSNAADLSVRLSPLVGVLRAFDETGVPLIRVNGLPDVNLMPARSVVPLSGTDVGREVVVLFDQGNPTRPLVMGVVRTPRREPVSTEIDGEKLVFTAEREIVLRCGEASITLTRAGKVLIRGAYVVNRSSGANKIKGAVVEIN